LARLRPSTDSVAEAQSAARTVPLARTATIDTAMPRWVIEAA
jgi:hypothetical protein